MGKMFSPPEPFASRGWKIKIYDRERVEPPHITVISGTSRWRYGLREQRFLDCEPDARDVPDEILEYLTEIRIKLIKAWDKLYPTNRVDSKVENDEDS